LLPSSSRARLFDVRVLLLAAAALVPLVMARGLLAYFDVTPKVALLLLCAALILLKPRAILYNLRQLLRSSAGCWLVFVLAAEWLAAAVGSALSSHPALSVDGSDWRRFGLVPETGLLLFVLLAAGWLAADRKNIGLMLRACTASGALGALYGIAQYFGWDPFLPSQAYQAGEGRFTIVRPPGPVGHADYFAAWMVIVVFFGLALSRWEQARWLRTGARATSGVAAVAILLSGTRAALLAVLIGAIVFLVAARPVIRARHAASVAGATACLLMFFFSPLGLKLRARLHWSIEDARGGARLLLWRDSLRMAERRLLTGFGPETFATEFPRFESVELARAYPDFYHESAHNMFLDALSTQGILGLLALAGLCAVGFRAAAPGWQSGNALATPLGAGLAAALVSQEFVAFIFTTALYFHLLVAVSVADSAPPREIRKLPRIGGWIFVPSCLVSLVLVVFAVRLLFADAYLAAAQRQIASGDAKGASEAYRSVLHWQPPGSGADLSYSRAMQQLAVRTPVYAGHRLARQQALEAAVRAVETAEDRHNAWYNLATLLAGDHDAAGTEHALRNAIAWAPNWFKPHWALAQLLELTGRHSAALQEARTAFELDGGKDPEVTGTWNRLNSAAAVPR